jgi:hypothetical protein
MSLIDAMTDAWHFLPADGMTRYAPRVPVIVGETLRVVLPIVLCQRGLHASLCALDALNYAPGPIVCRVRMSGDIKRAADKLVASERTVLWMYDATRVLHEFACCVAEAALLLAEVTDERSWRAIEAKRAWLRGEIGDTQLAAAMDAAREAARDAAWAAARDAARDAAWAAAWAAARDAASRVGRRVGRRDGRREGSRERRREGRREGSREGRRVGRAERAT